MLDGELAKPFASAEVKKMNALEQMFQGVDSCRLRRHATDLICSSAPLPRYFLDNEQVVDPKKPMRFEAADKNVVTSLFSVTTGSFLIRVGECAQIVISGPLSLQPYRPPTVVGMASPLLEIRRHDGPCSVLSSILNTWYTQL